MSYPSPIQKLIDSFKNLPGVGPRTAERYSFALLKLPQDQREQFAQAIQNAKIMKQCTQCGNFTDNTLCQICADPRRNKHLICVVADAQDLSAIERTAEYHGVYHILGGLLSPLEGTSPKDLRIEQLMQRVNKIKSIQPLNHSTIELILAFDQTPEGESTAIYLAKELKPTGAKITRLARGLPTGSDLNYADDLTLSSALSGRREV